MVYDAVMLACKAHFGEHASFEHALYVENLLFLQIGGFWVEFIEALLIKWFNVFVVIVFQHPLALLVIESQTEHIIIEVEPAVFGSIDNLLHLSQHIIGVGIDRTNLYQLFEYRAQQTGNLFVFACVIVGKVFFVASKQFVGTIAGEHHFDIFARQSGGIIGSYGRRVAEGFVVIADDVVEFFKCVVVL